MKTYKYKGAVYPDYLKRGNAVENIVPLAQKFCQGKGLDIGGTPDWHFPGATIVNTACPGYHQIPRGKFDFIFSSHCLEHCSDYVLSLTLWISKLRRGGQLFLYLPHPDMEYWLPQNCRKHTHMFEPKTIEKLLWDLKLKDVFVSGRDLYWSFAATGTK